MFFPIIDIVIANIAPGANDETAVFSRSQNPISICDNRFPGLPDSTAPVTHSSHAERIPEKMKKARYVARLEFVLKTAYPTDIVIVKASILSSNMTCLIILPMTLVALRDGRHPEWYCLDRQRWPASEWCF